MSTMLSVLGSDTLLLLTKSQGTPLAKGCVVAKGKPRSLSVIFPTCFLASIFPSSDLVSASLSDALSSAVTFSLSVSSSLIGRVNTWSPRVTVISFPLTKESFTT